MHTHIRPSSLPADKKWPHSAYPALSPTCSHGQLPDPNLTVTNFSSKPGCKPEIIVEKHALGVVFIPFRY